MHTREGIVGEAYTGDEDAALPEILAIVRDEIEPRLVGEDAFQVERCWELARPATFDILRDRRLGLVACGGVDTRHLGRRRQGARPAALAPLGRLSQPDPDDLDRRLLREVADGALP